VADTPQGRGYELEDVWAKLFGVEVQKGSGSVWYAKLDVADAQILWSCKHTDNESFRISKSIMREAEEAVTGPGGVGGSVIPGLATRIESGDVFVTLRAEDFLRLADSGELKYVESLKATAKRARSKTPALLREDDSG
jgi:hypothetical protein